MKCSTAQRFLTASILVFVIVAGSALRLRARAEAENLTCRLARLRRLLFFYNFAST